MDPVFVHQRPVRDTSGCLQIHKMSRFAWVYVGAETYVLDCLGQRFIKMGQRFIKIKPWVDAKDAKGILYYIRRTTPLSLNFLQASTSYKAQFLDYEAGRSATITTAASLKDAVREADSYVINKVFDDETQSTFECAP